MALLHVEFFSEVLQMCMGMDVILPQRTRGMIGVESKKTEEKCKTVYLLHGLSDNQTIWQRRTSIERYAGEYGIAVVMPTTHRAFFTDTTYGMKYWTFISDELPKICREFFPQMSDKKEDTLAAGLSMGGYGAWKLGLGASETFGAAASLSGVLDILSRYDSSYLAGADMTEVAGIFGSRAELENSINDLHFLLKDNVEKKRELPRLYAWCGTEDFLYKDNVKTWKLVKELGYDFTCEESEGGHEWQRWDAKIQDVLRWWLKEV